MTQREQDVADAVEIFEKAGCPNVIAVINSLVASESKFGITVLLDLSLLPKNVFQKKCALNMVLHFPSITLGRETGSALGDLLLVARRIKQFSETHLKIFDDVCAKIVESNRLAEIADPNDHGDVF